MEILELKNYTDQAENLLSKTKRAFQKLGLSKNSLPVTMHPQSGPLKLVFVGQYSAGKSSIIKMISGIETEIGAGITTQKASIYPWGDLEVVDTPGIQTGLRPDHDEITYDEINHAALLVFVITNEGFDQTMGNHFRKLAIEQHRGANMILLINKMDRAPLGNTKEQQDILLGDIRKVVMPLTPEALYTSFVSTECFEEAQAETDEELKADLLTESGYENLVKNLNDFVKAKGLAAKVVEPVYTLKAALDENAGLPQDDVQANKAEDLLKRKQRIIADAKADALEAIQHEAMGLQSDIAYIGRKAANDCLDAKSEEGVKEKFSSHEQEANRLVQQCAKQVDNIIKHMISEIDAEVQHEANSLFGQDVLNMSSIVASESNEKLGDKIDENKTLSYDNEELLGKAKDFVESGSKYFAKNAMKAGTSPLKTAWTGSLKGFRNSGLHKDVLKVASNLGVKFKPWQAVKITKALGVIGTVVSLGLMLHDLVTAGDSQREQERKVQQARQEIVGQFESLGQDAYHQLLQAAQQSIENITGSAEKEITNNLRNIESARELQIQRQKTLGELQKETNELIEALEA